MTENIICIKCPLGCSLKVDIEDGEVIKVMGQTCKEGKEYARMEVISPCRVLTTTIKTDNPALQLLPVRSDKEVPKDKLMDCMASISKASIKGDVSIGQIVIKDILGIGVNIISCRNIPSII